MLNLLSTTEKKKVLNEYRLRLLVVAMFAFGAFVLASLELLAPSYFLASIKYNNAESTAANLEKKFGSNEKEKELANQIREANSKISLLLNVDTSARLAPSQVIETILKIKESSIKIEGFIYDTGSAQERITVAGIARNRDSLARFVELLKKEPTFTSVTLPISSYVKSENIDFSIVIERKVATNAKAKK